MVYSNNNNKNHYKMTPVNNTNDRGPWMLTRSGVKFYPLDPRPEEFVIDDICRSLSKACRYNGHTPRFYSVAEHCTLLAQHFLDKNQIEHAKWAWAHDGAEAYIGDMIRPIKWLFPEFKNVEMKIEKVYFENVLGLEGECPKIVMDADTLICNDERYQLWDGVKVNGEYIVDTLGHNVSTKLGVEIRALDHDAAYDGFVAMYRELFLEIK